MLHFLYHAITLALVVGQTQLSQLPFEDALQGLWLFDDEHACNDISTYKAMPRLLGSQRLATDLLGPFGLYRTSYYRAKETMMRQSLSHLIVTEQVTIAFAFYVTEAWQNYGFTVIQFENINGSCKARLNIERSRSLLLHSNCDGIFEIRTSITANVWNFVSIAVAAFEKKLTITVTNEFGSHVTESDPNAKLWSSFLTVICNAYYMFIEMIEEKTSPPNTAISCLGIINVAMEPSNRVIFEACANLQEGDSWQTNVIVPYSENLVAFWPLDQKHLLHDVGPNDLSISTYGYQRLSTELIGPFGYKATSFSVQKNKMVFSALMSKNYTRNRQLSVAFVFFAVNSGPIFSFSSSRCFEYELIYEAPTTAVLWIPNNVDAETYRHFFEPKTWNFVALSIDGIENTTSLWTANKAVRRTRYGSLDFTKVNAIEFGSCLPFFPPDNSISCASIYNMVFSSWHQIEEIFEACRRIHEETIVKGNAPHHFEGGLWPLDSKRGSQEVALFYDWVSRPLMLNESTFAEGPFSIAETSLMSVVATVPIFETCSLELTPVSSFTIVFAFKPSSMSSNIVSLIPSLANNCDQGLSFSYQSPTTLAIMGGQAIIIDNIDDVIEPGAWNLRAVSYYSATDTLQVFSPSAYLKKSRETQLKKYVKNMKCLTVGRAGCLNSADQSFQPGSFISCLAFVNHSIVEPSSVSAIFDTCKKFHMELNGIDEDIANIVIMATILAGVITVLTSILLFYVLFQKYKAKVNRETEKIEDNANNYFMPTENAGEDLVMKICGREMADKINRIKIDQNIITFEGPASLSQGEFRTFRKAWLTVKSDTSEMVILKAATNKSLKASLELFREACTMSDLEHANILTVLGVVIFESHSPFSVFPLMENGNLLHYLENHKSLPDDLLVNFCTQICRGMAYLSSKNYIHRRLTCQSVLIDGSFTLKIADFSLAITLPNEPASFQPSPSQSLPIRWMPPETLAEVIVGVNIDVWMFGVVVWEIFSYGSVPYGEIPTERIAEHIRSGNRLTQPRACSDHLFDNIVIACWRDEPKARPTFDYLLVLLETYTPR